jgi:UDP-N-acetylglucosamine:LPS N-acetylglucosamine transferase
MSKRKTRFLVVCAAGGHLREALLSIAGVIEDFDLATYRQSHVKAVPGVKRLHYLIDPHISLWKYAINSVQSLWLLARVRPHVVITTGAGIAIPCALIGKLCGAKLIVVDTVACVNDLSRTGRCLYRHADLFIVQWPELCARYPKAVYGGCVL